MRDDFNGDMLRVTMADGLDTLVVWLDDYGYKDDINAFMCGKNVWFTFCDRDTNSMEDCEHPGDSGAGAVSNAAMDHDDDANDILVTRCEVGHMFISWPLDRPVLLGYPTLQKDLVKTLCGYKSMSWI